MTPLKLEEVIELLAEIKKKEKIKGFVKEDRDRYEFYKLSFCAFTSDTETDELEMHLCSTPNFKITKK